jgi:glutamine synthetase
MKPVAFYPDPFRGNPHILVVTESYNSDKVTPALGNFRYVAAKVMEDAKHEVPWFGIEQEYFLLNCFGTTAKWPLGWPKGGYPHP